MLKESLLRLTQVEDGKLRDNDDSDVISVLSEEEEEERESNDEEETTIGNEGVV